MSLTLIGLGVLAGVSALTLLYLGALDWLGALCKRWTDRAGAKKECRERAAKERVLATIGLELNMVEQTTRFQAVQVGNETSGGAGQNPELARITGHQPAGSPTRGSPRPLSPAERSVPATSQPRYDRVAGVEPPGRCVPPPWPPMAGSLAATPAGSHDLDDPYRAAELTTP